MELTLIISGALLPEELPAEHRKPLFADLSLPALASLLRQGQTMRLPALEVPARTSVLEHWLAESFKVPAGVNAPYCARLDGVSANSDALWTMQPVHFHVARDHIVLTDPAHLSISQEEADALLASITPLFSELHWQIHAAQPQRWYVSSPAPLQLNAASLEAAIGRNIDIYLPTGPDARQWKRLMNEVQMVWHTHPANAAREARGEMPVNSVWLHGGIGSHGSVPGPAQCFDAVYADSLYARALATASGAHAAAAQPVAKLTHPRTLQIHSQLQPALMAQDWYHWRDGWLQLEHAFLAPLRELLGRRILKRLTLVLCGEQQAIEVVVTPGDLWKFWRRATLEQSLHERSTSHNI
jgi:hypothetical protein